MVDTGVYALRDAGPCLPSKIAQLQTAVNGTANAFCLIGRFTAVNLPTSYDFKGIGVGLQRLDIESEDTHQDNTAALILFILAAVAAAAAIVLFVLRLCQTPSSYALACC